MSADDLLPQSSEERFLDTPYKDRHEQLKPVIVRLYLGNYGQNGKRTSMNDIVAFMRDNYFFHATAAQYKNWLLKWNVRRSTNKKEKNDVVNALSRRKRHLESSANVTLGEGEAEKELDRKQIKRHLRDQINHHQVEAASPGIISMWNRPYAAHVASLKRPGQPSPFSTTTVTPDYLNIASPGAPSPGPYAAGPSPTMQLVQKKAMQDRSNLLLQGRHIELLKSCRKEDQVALTNYFHDFFMHSFVTAKYWGKGPTSWTGGMISALTLGALNPSDSATSPAAAGLIAATSPGSSHIQLKDIPAPSNLCRWSIHVETMDYESIGEAPRDEPEEFDVDDPSSWRPWTREEDSGSILDSIQGAISNSTFSTTPLESIPVSNHLIAQSLQNSPTVQFLEACKFAIMAGNLEPIESLVYEDELEGFEKMDFTELAPFHLAAYFLDGGNKCCTIMDELLDLFPYSTLRDCSIDIFGLTILDSLLVSVLRSHTRLSPGDISAALGQVNTFPGDEKDICGRWDADSPEVRHLFQQGYSRIPSSWKHPFCHTAVQAVCHSAIAVYGFTLSPDINALSGLFSRRCISCGLELKLGPIHTLVLVAFHLSQHGMSGETLFGVIAIIVCLISLGAKASLKTMISVQELIQAADSGVCRHKSINAYELMMEVPEKIVDKWSRDCRTGWQCIRQVLRLAMRNRTSQNSEVEQAGDGLRNGFSGDYIESADDPMDLSDDGREEYDCDLEREEHAHSAWIGLPCGNAKLGLLWATIQTELLTYRRTRDEEPWISTKFSIEGLLDWLEGKSEKFDTPLVERGLMKSSHSVCGWFECSEFPCPVASDVSAQYFMNMDIFSRASYLPRPEFKNRWADFT